MLLKSRYILCSLITFCLGLTSVSAQVLGIRGEKHTGLGIYIKDIKADTIVYQHNAEQCLVPASITKSYTAASAMSLLSAEFRFETKVYLTGSAGDNGVWNGNIIIKASGDPTLDSENFKRNTTFMSEVITALSDKGITTFNGDILLERVNTAMQYEEGPNSTWNINDVAWAYGCGVFDFNWSDNIFGLYTATGRKTLDVPLKYTVWRNSYTTGLNMLRGVYSDSIIVMGRKYATDRKARVNMSMPYPFDAFRSTLIERMRAGGIDVTITEGNTADRKLLLTHKSPVLDDILKSLMLRSDNMFAEGILRVLGDSYGNIDASLDAESFLWKSRGLEPQYNRILDGSGLSRANAISSRFFGDMLEWMAKSEYKKRYTTLFPVAGVSGTMKSFMATTPLKGRLAMKTGSVNAVQTYAGYLLDAGGNPTHVVVLMVNNFFCTRTQLREALGTLLLNTLKPYIN